MDKDKLNLIIDRFPGQKICVWGDLILDEYLFGTTRRISREAPVLILSYRNTEFYLGGAGNTLLNLKNLDADPFAVGVIGRDSTGKCIEKMLNGHDISTEGIIRIDDFMTPLKTRILAGEETTRKQQILRIDRESRVPDNPEIRSALHNVLESGISSCKALLISDYDYATVTEEAFARLLPDFRERSIPITVDSRFNLMKFKGVALATPNESEVESSLGVKLTNDEQIMTSGIDILNKIMAEAVLITQGAKGMTLFEKNKPPFAIPIHGTTDIIDVSGAGDTVISVMTLALACGADFKEAAILANLAGSIVVMKKGTAPVTRQELKNALVS